MSLEELKRSIARGGVVVIAGAGCSIAATGGHTTVSWIGLINNGIEFAVAHDATTTPN